MHFFDTAAGLVNRFLRSHHQLAFEIWSKDLGFGKELIEIYVGASATRRDSRRFGLDYLGKDGLRLRFWLVFGFGFRLRFGLVHLNFYWAQGWRLRFNGIGLDELLPHYLWLLHRNWDRFWLLVHWLRLFLGFLNHFGSVVDADVISRLMFFFLFLFNVHFPPPALDPAGAVAVRMLASILFPVLPHPNRIVAPPISGHVEADSDIVGAILIDIRYDAAQFSIKSVEFTRQGLWSIHQLRTQLRMFQYKFISSYFKSIIEVSGSDVATRAYLFYENHRQ
jgi:hypothetical protein